MKGSKLEDMHKQTVFEQNDLYGYLYICMYKVIPGRRLEATKCLSVGEWLISGPHSYSSEYNTTVKRYKIEDVHMANKHIKDASITNH